VVSVRISLNAKFERPLRRIADEYGISFSDIMNEISEWVLDQEADFRRDLEHELGETGEDWEDEEEEEEEDEEEEE